MENITAAESPSRHDMAEEMVSYTRSASLNQASTSMLAQANVKRRPC
jgi:flagellin-like hook-associated protein FlgL